MRKDIPGLEGLYSADTEGRIWSEPRIGSVGGYKSKELFELNQLLREEVGKTPYYVVHITTNGKTKQVKVHTLVAETFVPNPENKPIVNHIDSNSLNNKPENLEWATHSENNKHAWASGRRKPSKPLTPAQREEIRDMFKSGMATKDIILKTGRPRQTVYDNVQDLRG